MNHYTGKFSFTVPEGHADAGKKIEKPFECDLPENEVEAQQIMSDKKLSLVDLVSDKVKANARSSAYQAATIVYRPSDVSEDDIKERMVRDFIRLGMSEEAARALVTSSVPPKQ